MDLSSRLLILMLQRGQWQRVLESNALWMCSSCHLCPSRWPRGVRPADVVERHGILPEPELLQAYGGMKAILEPAHS